MMMVPEVGDGVGSDEGKGVGRGLGRSEIVGVCVGDGVEIR